MRDSISSSINGDRNVHFIGQLGVLKMAVSVNTPGTMLGMTPVSKYWLDLKWVEMD
jgi:hypothetical protein